MRLQFNLISLLFASSAAHAQSNFNLTQGVTPLSHDIYVLHMTIFWVCVVIGIIVFGVMLYSIIYHRKSSGHKAVQFHENTWLEITWSIIPLLILVFLAVPATMVLRHMNDTAKADITIKITGYQWKWRYEYLGEKINFFSNFSTPIAQLKGTEKKSPLYLRTVDHPLVVPIHQKIRFLMTSNDVIHSWWVPDLGVKRDALPGYINEAWARINRPGTYYGQCTELCGMNHAYMPIVVIALDEQDYQKWVAAQKGEGEDETADLVKTWTRDELMARGEKTYMGICAACHQPTGMGMPPTFPALNGSPIVNGPIAGHIDRVMNGKAGTAMQAFKTQLSDTDIAAVITYERNSWNNKTGILVQPIEIKAARDGKTVAEEQAALPKSTKPATPVKPGVATPMPGMVTQHGAQPAKPVPPSPPAPVQPSALQPATPVPASTNPPATPATETNATPAASQPPAAGQLSKEQLMQQGQQVFESTCAVCHQTTGEGQPPVYPALKGSAIVIGPIDVHLNRVLNGKMGTAMQAFKDQLNDNDLAAVITYERNSWGNNASIVQPAEVTAARAKPSTGN
jgi:cytochrome c oxidase subunit II